MNLDSVKGKCLWTKIAEDLEVAQGPPQVFARLTEVGDFFLGNPHQTARGAIDRQGVIPDKERIHAPRSANDRTAALQTNASIDNAEVRRAELVEAADKNRKVRMK